MTRADLSGRSVLLVDDEELFRMTLRAALEAFCLGLDVREAACGEAALAALADRPADCVVTDLAMAPVDGVALLSELLRAQSAVSVIVVSAYASPGPPTEDALLCFGKPVDLYGLCAAVGALASGARRSRVTLSSLVHLLVCEQRSCALHLEAGGGASAELVFASGALVGAAARTRVDAEPLLGLDGALEALTWAPTRVTRERRATRSSIPPGTSAVSLENLFAQVHARARVRAVI